MFAQLVVGHPHGGPHHGGVATVAQGLGLPAHHDVDPPVLLVERSPHHLQHAPVVPHQTVNHLPRTLDVVGGRVGEHRRGGAHPVWCSGELLDHCGADWS